MTCGCVTKLNVTYYSDPPGASLYQGNQMMGYCPTTLIYDVSYDDRMNGYKLLQGTQVKWVSGASAKIDQLKATIESFTTYRQFTFMRPSDIEGYETDAKFGIEVQKVRLMGQQVQTQQDANLWQKYSTMVTQNSTVNLKTNCTSNVIGETVFTNCI